MVRIVACGIDQPADGDGQAGDASGDPAQWQHARASRQSLDFANHPVALPPNGRKVLGVLTVVAKRLPQQADTLRQGFIAHDDIAPDLANQLVFAHGARRMR